MNCQKCSYKLGGDWSFCPKCGIAAPPKPAASGSYGSDMRAQVLEVIVRQAMIGAPWQEICQGPMEVNKITVEEVEEAVRKRGDGGSFKVAARKPKGPSGGGIFSIGATSKPKTPSLSGSSTEASTPSQKLKAIANSLSTLLKSLSKLDASEQAVGEKIIADVKALEAEIESSNQATWYQQSEANLQSDLERELTKRPPHNPGGGGPSPIN